MWLLRNPFSFPRLKPKATVSFFASSVDPPDIIWTNAEGPKLLTLSAPPVEMSHWGPDACARPWPRAFQGLRVHPVLVPGAGHPGGCDAGARRLGVRTLLTGRGTLPRFAAHLSGSQPLSSRFQTPPFIETGRGEGSARLIWKVLLGSIIFFRSFPETKKSVPALNDQVRKAQHLAFL